MKLEVQIEIRKTCGVQYKPTGSIRVPKKGDYYSFWIDNTSSVHRCEFDGDGPEAFIFVPMTPILTEANYIEWVEQNNGGRVVKFKGKLYYDDTLPEESFQMDSNGTFLIHNDVKVLTNLDPLTFKPIRNFYI